MKTILSILILLSISFNANAKIQYTETDYPMENLLNMGYKIINTNNVNSSTRFTLYKKNHSIHVCDLNYTGYGPTEKCYVGR